MPARRIRLRHADEFPTTIQEMNSQAIDGLHHVTALCGDPQRNFDFYTGVLGLRLVKKTVNFDDPSAYHLYYADGAGTPGSVITFFPWKDMPNGRDGTGQVGATAFATKEAALPYWEKRLKEKGVNYRGPMQRFNEVYIEFTDPDGLPLEIVVADQSKAFQPWSKAPVPADMQLCGFHSVTLSEAGYELTQALLSHQMGWTQVGQSAGRFRYQAPGAGPASLVDILCQPGARHGLPGSEPFIMWPFACRTTIPNGCGGKRWSAKGTTSVRSWIAPIFIRSTSANRAESFLR